MHLAPCLLILILKRSRTANGSKDMNRQHLHGSGNDDPRLVPWWFALILITLFLWGMAYLANQFI